jgi:hypothetical protein
MRRKLELYVCLSAALGIMTAFCRAQSRDAVAKAAAAAPVAYVYIANTPANSSTNQITAYTADANGTLSPLAGSPFAEDVAYMVVTGTHLMAVSRSEPNINAYLIASDGTLSFEASTDYAQYNSGSNDCGSAGQIFLDHTGATLYVQEFDGSSACANTVIASFKVEKPGGELKYLGTDNTGVFPGVNSAAYFIGNNMYAYTSADSACMYYAFYGFKRASNGLLSSLDSMTSNLPTAPEGVSRYVPSLAAADPTDHVAFLMQPANPPGCAPGPLQLANYTVDASGNLSTTNTSTNMPATSIVNFSDMKMSPSGELLAVAGAEGLQVFHFNGANPITQDTGLLTSDPVAQMFWDNNDHLYAISTSSAKLHVFTVTPTTVAEAPGSPYSIASPENLIVRSLAAAN